MATGEESETDWLYSVQKGTALRVMNENEVDTTFKKSNAQDILDSYNKTTGILINNSNNTDVATMVDFRKYIVDGYPVIRYIVHYTKGSVDEYQGELIVFPSNKPYATLRMFMTADERSGCDEINDVFDSLTISPRFALTANDTGKLNANRITVK